MLKIAVIGYGNRAKKYLSLLESASEGGKRQKEVQVVAVVEPDAIRLQAAAERYALPASACYAEPGPFFRDRKKAAAVMVCSPDKAHFAQALKAMEAGCRILLEKPVGSSEEECRALLDAAMKYKADIVTCMVLRYHPLFRRVKEITSSGVLGKVLSIKHRIDVGKDRMTHTFVRGLWSKEAESAPILVSKCCHDMDWLLWVAGAGRVERMRSEGAVSLFNPANAPEDSTPRCIGCPVEKSCRFSAVDLYARRKEWVSNFDIPQGCTLDDVIREELRNGRYGRCVFRCDNDVADFQTVNLSLEGGTEISLIMDGHADEPTRSTEIRCSGGSIMLKDYILTIEDYESGETRTEDFSHLASKPLHAGADLAVMEDFISPSLDADARLRDFAEIVKAHEICFRGAQYPLVSKSTLCG